MADISDLVRKGRHIYDRWDNDVLNGLVFYVIYLGQYIVVKSYKEILMEIFRVVRGPGIV